MFRCLLIVCLLGYVSGASITAQCPEGEEKVQCLVNPCDSASCLTGLTCVPNYCGGCNYDCVCQQITVNCFVDPCMFVNCPTNNACVSNYCGGCNWDCVPGTAELS